jgi:surface protein
MKLKHLLNEDFDKVKKLILKEFETYDDFMEFVKTFSKRDFKVRPKTEEELQEIIKNTISEQGNNCDLNFIDTSLITDMTNLFMGMFNFNGKIDKWNTSNVTSMRGMFRNAESFNQPIGNWDTSRVTDMSYMFVGAESFNQPIDKWDTSKVTNMGSMFRDAKSFNRPIDKWDVSKVRSMLVMFDDTKLEKSGNLPDWFNKK